ncbi:hypothetical protein [Streptomyces angustmyceticus]|uniref:hypothetical protein n=1 Tax=Streptomyces angustmyceticus TaxID=285578 RepID=UPI0034500ED9
MATDVAVDAALDVVAVTAVAVDAALAEDAVSAAEAVSSDPQVNFEAGPQR